MCVCVYVYMCPVQRLWPPQVDPILICVCMYVCVYVLCIFPNFSDAFIICSVYMCHMHAFMHVSMYTCILRRSCFHVYVCMFLRIFSVVTVYTSYVCMYVCVCMYPSH